jgi:glutamate decarboxylase
MQKNGRALAGRLQESGNFELIGADKEQLPLVAFKLAEGKNYDEFDLSWQLSAERGWMLPAYTLPPNAEKEKVLRALVKETLSREQVDRLADDIATACSTLEKKGGAHPSERKQVKTGTGY